MLSGSNTWASAVKKLADFASLYRLATVQPLNSGSKGLWIGRKPKRSVIRVLGQREYTRRLPYVGGALVVPST